MKASKPQTAAFSPRGKTNFPSTGSLQSFLYSWITTTYRKKKTGLSVLADWDHSVKSLIDNIKYIMLINIV